MVSLADRKQSPERPTLCSADVMNQESHALGGTLYSIPLELRDAIYRDVLSEGHLSILQVSKLINVEATAALHRTVPCCMYVGYPRIGCPQEYRRRPAASCFPIQNFELYVNFSRVIGYGNELYFLFPPIYFEPISVFGDPNVCRQSMVLLLDHSLHNTALGLREYLKMLFGECRHVLGFRSLILVFLTYYADHTLGMKRNNVQGIARDLLDPKLGPSVCYEDEDGLCVEYKPWAFVSRQCRVSQEYWRGIQYTRFTYEVDGNKEFPATKADALQASAEEVLEWQLAVDDKKGDRTPKCRQLLLGGSDT